MVGFKIDFSNISPKQVLEDSQESDLPDSLKNLADGIPTHEEINANTEILYDGPMLTLQDRQVASIGNGLLIIAPQKTGKSQVCEAIATAIVITSKPKEEKAHIDNLGFKFFPQVDKDGNIDNRGCLYIDTERSRNQFKKGFSRIAHRAEIEPDAAGRLPKLKAVSLFGCMDTTVAREIIKEYLDTGEYSFLILDGAGDFVVDENDLKEAKNFVRWVIVTATKYNIGYVITIHPNPNDQEGKGTGHLGTFLAKKLEAIVNMFFNEDGNPASRCITSNTKQGGTRNDDSNINQIIYYDKEKWMFLSDNETKIRDEAAWMPLLRNRKFMDEDEFLKMYGAKTDPNQKRKMKAYKSDLTDLIERGILHRQNNKIMFLEDQQTVNDIADFPTTLVELGEAHGMRPEEYDPNHFPTNEDKEEIPLF